MPLHCVHALLQVRYARSHQYVQAGTGPEDNRQLFFARAPTSCTEDHLKELFGKYGQVRMHTEMHGLTKVKGYIPQRTQLCASASGLCCDGVKRWRCGQHKHAEDSQASSDSQQQLPQP